jgi:hypothetical protein
VCQLGCVHMLCCQLKALGYFTIPYSTLADVLQADGNWETLEYGKAAVSGEYIVEEEPDDDKPGGVTR